MLVSSDALWHGLMSTEPWAYALTQIPRTTHRRLVSLAQRALAFAVPSICSSEGDRIDAFREMICSDTVEEREEALEKILPLQQGDFEQLYEAMEGNPVTIRFLDPPLHEFVPTEEEDIEKLAKAKGKTVAEIKGNLRVPA